jgi:hypothetical protein
MAVDKKVYWALKDRTRKLLFFGMTEKQVKLLFFMHIRQSPGTWLFRRPFDEKWQPFEGTKEHIFNSEPSWFKPKQN